MTDPIAFNARYISTFTPDRLYRIYIAGSDLCFIQIGGQFSGSAWGMLFGNTPLTRDAQAFAAAADMADPRYLATAGKHNLLLSAGEIASSSLDMPPLLPQHGPCLARWRIKPCAGRQLTLQFEQLPDLIIAFERLPALLGPILAVNIAWDAARRKFIRRKTP